MLQIGLSFSIIIGILMSFQTQSAVAKSTYTANKGTSQTCWYQADANPSYRYISCSNCQVLTGKPYGSSGTCGLGISIEIQ